MSDDSTRTDETRMTTDHGTIRNWIESNDLAVARTAETARNRSGGLTVVTEGRTDDSIKEVSWDEFFETFEDEGLAFVYRTETMGPEEQLYYEFVPREDAEGATDGTSTTEATGLDTLAKLEGRTTGAESPTGEEPLGAGEVDEEEIVAGETTNRRETQDDGLGEGTDPVGEDVPETEPSDEEPGDGNDTSTAEESDGDEAAGIEGDDADPSGNEATEQRERDEDDS
ncbi:hypothetical protein ACFQGH_15700 [Halalkalicoccus tibetensis]|uniref:Amphi-Trp domain-containing protein n=2 Tax=Halalkalicoccus tibetensis TaxID=175632 RepID=A0ABD5V908_9EURY